MQTVDVRPHNKGELQRSRRKIVLTSSYGHMLSLSRICVTYFIYSIFNQQTLHSAVWCAAFVQGNGLKLSTNVAEMTKSGSRATEVEGMVWG